MRHRLSVPGGVALTARVRRRVPSPPGAWHRSRALSVPNTLRQSVERASLPLLTRLSALPRPVPFRGHAGPAGRRRPRAAAVGRLRCFLVVADPVVGWLLYLSWPRLTVPERLMRVAVLAAGGRRRRRPDLPAAEPRPGQQRF